MMSDTRKYLEFLIKAQNLTLSEFKTLVSSVVGINGYLIQALFEIKPKLNEGEVYIETFVSKILFTSQSILHLCNSHKFKIEKYDNRLEVIDTQSIFILTRSIIEGFLSLEYLYFNQLSLEEKQFRFKLWRVSGIMSRQQFADSISDQFREKLERERILIEQIKAEIKNSPYYSTLDKQHLWKLDRFGLPRLNSWGQLLSDSILKHAGFKKIYALYSNYAHSEYLSMMQINEGSMHKDDPRNLEAIDTVLNIVCMINSVLAELLIQQFPALNSKYEELEESIRYPIQYWGKVAKSL
jgi:hypothetical protein